jgi:formate-dependent nitrite reductase membrane component NrfD
MNQKYKTGVRFNHQFGILETISFVGEGVGAALYIVAVFEHQWPIAALGVAFVIAAGLALRAHLGKPTPGWRAFTRLSTSWVSRGTLVITGFLGLATLSIAAQLIGIHGPVLSMLVAVALVFAVLVILYAGMLLRSMRAIRFWRGPLLPASFSAHSWATALTISLALMPWLTDTLHREQWLLPAAAGCLLLCLVTSVAHLLRLEASAGTRASTSRLFHGDLRRRFIWGAVVFGAAVPLVGLTGCALLIPLDDAHGKAVVFTIIALLRLFGDFEYRQSIVVAGAFEPIVPTGSNRSMIPRRA